VPVVERPATLDAWRGRIDRAELAIHRYYVLTMAAALPGIDAALFDAAAARLRVHVRYGHLAGLTGGHLWDRLYAVGINNLVRVMGEALVRRDAAEGRDDAGDVAEWITTGRVTPGVPHKSDEERKSDTLQGGTGAEDAQSVPVEGIDGQNRPVRGQHTRGGGAVRGGVARGGGGDEHG